MVFVGCFLVFKKCMCYSEVFKMDLNNIMIIRFFIQVWSGIITVELLSPPDVKVQLQTPADGSAVSPLDLSGSWMDHCSGHTHAHTHAHNYKHNLWNTSKKPHFLLKVKVGSHFWLTINKNSQNSLVMYSLPLQI